MADEWFFQQGEYEVGPLRPKELLEYVRKGIIRAETPIRKGDSSWTAASEVGGLFDAARRPTTIYYCPQCNKEVEKPPSYCTSCEKFLERAPSRTRENRLPGDETGKNGSRITGGAFSHWLSRLRKDSH